MSVDTDRRRNPPPTPPPAGGELLSYVDQLQPITDLIEYHRVQRATLIGRRNAILAQAIRAGNTLSDLALFTGINVGTISKAVRPLLGRRRGAGLHNRPWGPGELQREPIPEEV